MLINYLQTTRFLLCFVTLSLHLFVASLISAQLEISASGSAKQQLCCDPAYQAVPSSDTSTSTSFWLLFLPATFLYTVHPGTMWLRAVHVVRFIDRVETGVFGDSKPGLFLASGKFGCPCDTARCWPWLNRLRSSFHVGKVPGPQQVHWWREPLLLHSFPLEASPIPNTKKHVQLLQWDHCVKVPQQRWQFTENDMFELVLKVHNASSKVCPMLLLLRWSQILSTRVLGVGKPRTQRQCRASQLLSASRCSQVVTALFAMSFSKWGEISRNPESLRTATNRCKQNDSLTGWNQVFARFSGRAVMDLSMEAPGSRCFRFLQEWPRWARWTCVTLAGRQESDRSWEEAVCSPAV